MFTILEFQNITRYTFPTVHHTYPYIYMGKFSKSGKDIDCVEENNE